ncbi:DUF1993 domain-containing protein [Rhizobium sp. TRM96647]|uniref:DUF1993 domain-containing protein n=1 Tax=unclassified Rhizobium TaxID=2613769 RepID=UPI0021E7D30F|nr:MULTISPECIES: DUF1993 domain-containing protein [unclassified Rhizobium]MCV3738094.1 DUF1993 domain-containing protein [Rhizobium sp. TRM96647]MCV3759781.1 DUF1993 domain-containing protein [Rhizobium sp. TRM96650]
MSVSLYRLSVPVFVRGLKVLSALLEKAEAHAADNGIDPEVLVNSRLAPDMLPLSGQIQRVSDTAKNALGRLSGKSAPSFPDTETTMAELKARIEKTIAYLESVPESDLAGSETREVKLNVGNLGVTFTGTDYLLEFALPNFFFHVTTAYDILRHDGIEIGKRDYLGPYG